jgi:DNA-binding MarR family transcriptional regulator
VCQKLLSTLPYVHGTSLQELTLLELIDRTRHVSQRQVADLLGLSPSHVNRLLRRLMDEGLIEVEDEHVRPFNYQLTTAGRAQQQRLGQEEARSVVDRFRALERKILARLGELRSSGLTRVVFYGAGEIMEVALHLATRAGIEVVAIADDDPSRHGVNEEGVEIVSGDAVSGIAADAVVITTYRHADAIRARLGACGMSCCPVVEL